MADYKDMLTGTLGSIVNMVKDVADSTGVTQVYKQGADRAATYGKIMKLTVESNADAEELKRIYTEIGRLYYEQTRDEPQGYFAPLFAQAKEIMERISRRDGEIEELRSGVEDKDIDVEITQFEDVIDATQNEGTGKEE